MVLRFVKGQFHEYQESTIGAAFLTQTVSLDDTTVKFEIWDTAGQERYLVKNTFLTEEEKTCYVLIFFLVLFLIYFP